MAGWFDLPRHAAVVLLLGLALPAAAQTNVQSPQDPAKPAAAADPYGRTTPRGTVTGLGQAVNREDASAARYLSELIERYFFAPLTALSGAPEGVTTDGLPLDRERVVLTIGDTTHDIVLVRSRTVRRARSGSSRRRAWRRFAGCTIPLAAR